jgi:hypothetical protein
MNALGEGAGFSSLPPTIRDLQQLFYKGNERDLVMEIHAADAETGTYSKQIVLTFDRNTGRAKLSLQDLPATFTQIRGEQRGEQLLLNTRTGNQYDLTRVLRLFRELTNTVYVGPYRSIGQLTPTGVL